MKAPEDKPDTELVPGVTLNSRSWNSPGLMVAIARPFPVCAAQQFCWQGRGESTGKMA
jgi:hypothetical protein